MTAGFAERYVNVKQQSLAAALHSLDRLAARRGWESGRDWNILSVNPSHA